MSESAIAVTNSSYLDFLQALEKAGFAGEVSPDKATRLSLATDNSVYQIMPQGAVFPKHEADLLCLFKLAGEARFKRIQFAPRGGGTGTNGQSLNSGLVVDCSRHMRAILELNLEQGYVRVQPGIIRDQLNDALRPHGVFFAPSLSTSNRATLGGMCSTDACGQGSRIYGRTSNHVMAMQIILADGEQLTCQPLDTEALHKHIAEGGRSAELYQQVAHLVQTKAGLIAQVFPQLNRFMTGYNLAHVEQDETFNLGALICGSEGTLAMVSELTLRLTPVPKYKQLLALRYNSFEAALRDAKRLVELDPDAIETIDDTIIELAKSDVIWHRVGGFLGAEQASQVKAVNLVEFSSMQAQDLNSKVDAVCADLDVSKQGIATGYFRTDDAQHMLALWELRKKGVGLLGNVKGQRRPIPFVEDTAVPPEHLADYITEFRALLDGLDIRYGMFGHVDAGCLHVRPALNMRDPDDAKLMHHISDAVEQLVRKYGGVMWGEHGKGFRSEYTPAVIGPELYQDMRQIKAWFDPHNQLNPGKICTPIGCEQPLVRVDDPRTRGALDRQIPEQIIEQWEPVVACNGNGACFNYQPEAEMCPSYKATGDRVQSPKGRATLLREWLRQTQTGQVDRDFEDQVYAALNSCLACKACTTQCPIKVDIPTYRSRFLAAYFARRRRPLRDYLIAAVEEFGMLAGRVSAIINPLMQTRLAKTISRQILGMQNLPAIYAYRLTRLTSIAGVEAYNKTYLAALSSSAKQRHLLIVQDAFTSCFDLPTMQAILQALVGLGFTPVVLPLHVSGKARHVKGYTKSFASKAQRQASRLKEVAQSGVTLVAVDPSVGLIYRDEYQHIVPDTPPVLLLQEWLAKALQEVKCPDLSMASDNISLLAHCSEKAMVPNTNQLWQQIFNQLGMVIQTPAAGCCGMAGTFGHEVANQDLAQTLYAMSWQQPVQDADVVLATGYSCRSQAAAHGQSALHPLHYLQQLMAAQREPS
ncbi:MAG: FAD-binding and (Fe-S)-binding domain-containing protein [Gammaproteobacteria bacterium]|jgi:FAD/FMN-containing dehydrogenase/Fe-S oxidoreductase|nr:FAD-binding and (Fe-S)-binding domain-containing protein [Gammaproteobacteria bacterium]